jgi:hypothetical protein
MHARTYMLCMSADVQLPAACDLHAEGPLCAAAQRVSPQAGTHNPKQQQI